MFLSRLWTRALTARPKTVRHPKPSGARARRNCPLGLTQLEDRANPATVDLFVTKDDGVTAVNPGQNITYTIVVGNNGPNTATDASVQDLLSTNPNLTNVVWTSVASGGATGNTAAGTGDINDTGLTIPTGDTITYTVTATVADAATATGPVTNTATVDAGTDADTDTSNNSATDTDLLNTDLQVTKTAAVNPDGTVTYTITVTNAGPGTATNATVTDTFPAAFTGVSYTSVGSTGVTGNDAGPTTGDINDTGITIPSGGTVTYTATGTVATDTTGPISNTATAAVDATANADTAPGNNSDSTTTGAPVDLQVTKSAVVNADGTVTYTITVHNAGPGTATNATVTDAFPAAFTGVTYTSVGSTGVTGNDAGPTTGDINDTGITIPSGGSVTYTATGTVAQDTTGPIGNTATATVDTTNNTEAAPGNNSDSTTTGAPVDLQVTKTAAVNPDGTVTYTITVTNAGPGTATNATVTDTFPAAFTGVSYTSVGSTGVTGNDAGPTTGDINDTGITIPSGGTVTYTATGTVATDTTGPISNTATAAVDTTNNTEATPADNTASASTGAPVDLQVTKTAAVNPDGTVTYTITVTNAGPGTATGATVADTFPAAFTSVTYTSVGSTGVTGNTAGPTTGDINDTVTIPSGGTVTYTATGTVATDTTGPISNTATAAVDTTNNTEATPADNTATSSTGAPVDLQVTKSAVVNADGTVTYTITVHNAGPGTATNATVTDAFPAAFTSVTYTSVGSTGVTGNDAGPTTGDINDTGITIPSSGSVTYTATGTVANTATGPISNTATAAVDATANADTAPGNNSDSTSTPTPVDLQVTKTITSGSATPGGTVTYTITVTNAGPGTATNATVTDTFDPTQFSSVSYTSVGSTGVTGNDAGPTTGDINDTGITIPSGGTVTYTVTATVAAGATSPVQNTATAAVDTTNNTEVNAVDNSATATGPTLVDLSVTKTDGSTTVTGGTVTYTIVVTNNGPNTATGVTVTDTFDTAAFSSVSYTSVGSTGVTGNDAGPTTGDINDTGITIPSGGTVTYTVTATVANTATGPVVNTATVAAGSANFETNTANNSATDTDLLGTTTTLTTSGTPSTTGQAVTFTATVTSAAGANPTTGTVQFLADGTEIGTTALSGSNVATFTTSTLAAGTRSITAVYQGTSAYATSASTPVVQQVNTPTPANPPAVSRNLVVSGLLNGSAQVFAPTGSGGLYGTTPVATQTPFGSLSTDVRSAVGDVDDDGFEDTIYVTGPGTAIKVTVISGKDGSVLVAPFSPFAGSEDFTGGGFVSAGDIDGDGRAEFAVSPDQGGGPRVTIFSLPIGQSTAVVKANFLGIDDVNFRGGARTALGDVNGDHVPDLAVAAGFLGGPRVAIFNGTTLLGTPTRLVNDFFAFPGTDAVNLRNGAYVAIGDVDADGKGDLIFGGGPGGAPRVFILSGALVSAGNIQTAYNSPIASFFVAGDSTDRGGVRVAAKDAGQAGADVVVGSGQGSPARVRVYPGGSFAAGTGEPAGFQDLTTLGGAALTDGVFVG